MVSAGISFSTNVLQLHLNDPQVFQARVGLQLPPVRFGQNPRSQLDMPRKTVMGCFCILSRMLSPVHSGEN